MKKIEEKKTFENFKSLINSIKKKFKEAEIVQEIKKARKNKK